MTKKELIDFLAAYEDNQRIEIFDSAYGCIDITEVFSNEHHKSIVLSQRLTHYKKTYTNDMGAHQATMGALLFLLPRRVAGDRRDPICAFCIGCTNI